MCRVTEMPRLGVIVAQVSEHQTTFGGRDFDERLLCFATRMAPQWRNCILGWFVGELEGFYKVLDAKIVNNRAVF